MARPPVRRAVPALFFLSGFTALVYQVLWIRDLGLLFGNTAHAAATTIAVFFLGLAVGGGFWGRRAPRLRNPLATYGALEVGIGVAGLLYFGLIPLYRRLYAPLYGSLEEHFPLLVATKFLLALLLLFPSAFLMGGNFPVVGQLLVRRAGELGRVGSFLYGLNTTGAAVGALAAGFYLPRILGFAGAYLLAVVLSVGIGAGAWWLSRGLARRQEGRAAPTEPGTGREGASARGGSVGTDPPGGPWGAQDGATRGPRRAVLVIASASGFLALALEVVWTRMFAQVLQNSVYTFSVILVVFLVALGAGSFTASRLSRLKRDPRAVLLTLLVLSALAVSATPFLFHGITGGLGYIGTGGGGWTLYVLSVFAAGAAVLFLPVLFLGTVFPYLLRVEEARGEAPGAVIGRLLALNTAGGMAGALVAGFVLLPVLGMWRGLLFLAAAYLALAVLPAWGERARMRTLLPMPAAALLILLTLANPTRLPLIHLEDGERVLGLWEGSDGVVAVVERDGARRIKVNNYYTLGGTAAMDGEQNQALLPLMAHPRPDSVFFLGMGTGITAGAALHHPVRHVTVAELVPEVVTAASRHFGPYANQLFSDPRVRVLARDGRSHLAGTRERYDVIVSDLFIPWRAGVGNLYTLEHYQAARDRLRPGGHFVQWLPLYQISEREFHLIARTMLEAFPQLVVWRGDFFAGRPILALVGSVDAPPLDPATVARAGRLISTGGDALPDHVFEAVTLPFYVGNLAEAPHLVPSGPINTDHRPRLEYEAPITHRAAAQGGRRWFVGAPLMEFYEELHQTVRPEDDPYLSRLGEERHGYVRAGHRYFRAVVLRELGRTEEANAAFQDFLTALPVEFVPETDGSEAYSDFPR